MFARTVQLAGVCLLGAGVVLELVHRADLYLVLITVGSAVFALGTKLTRRE